MWIRRSLVRDQEVVPSPPLKINEPKSGLFYFDGLAQFAVCTIVDKDLVFAGYNRIPCIALGEGCGG